VTFIFLPFGAIFLCFHPFLSHWVDSTFHTLSQIKLFLAGLCFV
jgi:hypothetical protein